MPTTPPASPEKPCAPAPGAPALPPWRRWFLRWLPVLVALAVGLAFQGTRGLHETSETRYAECAREMLVSGNWLEPTLDFQPHWTKPPFTYWAIAAGMKVFGVNEWGARLPSVLALVIATWAVAAAARIWRGPAVGLIAGVVYGSGLLTLGAAHVLTTDIFLGMATALGGAAFFRATRAEPAGARRRWMRWMWAAYGLAFLIKGPPALLPLAAFVVWNWMQPAARRVPLFDPLGLVAFAVVALWWYVTMLVRHPELLGYYFGEEVVGRMTSEEGHNSAWWRSFEIYGPSLGFALGAFGWWALVLAARRDGWLTAARWRALWQSRDERLLLLLWLVIPLAVFCSAKSKLHFYVVPLAMPLALATGAVLARHATWRTLGWVLGVSLAAGIGAKAAYAHLPARRDMAPLAAEVRRALDAQPAARVAIWDEPRNHGLTFYLGLPPDRLVERIAVDEKGKFERYNLAEFREAWRAGRWPAGLVLVVSARKRAEFDRGWPDRPQAEETRGRYWHILRLAPSGAGRTLAP